MRRLSAGGPKPQGALLVGRELFPGQTALGPEQVDEAGLLEDADGCLRPKELGHVLPRTGGPSRLAGAQGRRHDEVVHVARIAVLHAVVLHAQAEGGHRRLAVSLRSADVVGAGDATR